MGAIRAIKLEKLFKLYATFSVAFLLAFISSSLLTPAGTSSAVDCTDSLTPSGDICSIDTTDVNVSIEGAWTVAVSSSGTLNVDVIPKGSGATSTATDNVNIYTNTPNGYQLYLNSTSGSTDIYNNSDTQKELNHFTSTTGTKEDPVALTNNTWGYSLATSPTTFSKVELTNTSADSLISTGSKTTGAGDNIDITYGFMADTKLTPGTYSTQVTYTAIADTPSYTLTSITPNELYTNDQTDKQVTILTTTPASELGLGDITAKITDGTSTVNLTNCTEITEVVSGTSYRGAECTYPGTLPMGYYTVELTSSWHNATYTLTNGFRIRDYRTMSNITYMQDMNSDICENTTTNQKVSLLDSRGYGNAGSNKTTKYGVVKAQDGNCWMTDNLNLYNVTISANTSDFTSPTNYTIPADITATTDWNTNNYTTKKVEVAHGLGRYATTDSTYYGQVFYNWTVAVAKETTASVTTAPDTSICPKGWTLPTNGDKGVNKSWAKLLDTYSITTGAQLLANTNLGFSLYYGYWDLNYASEFYQGSYGDFWSGTPSSEIAAYSLYYYSGAVGPQSSSRKGAGFSIRCVAR